MTLTIVPAITLRLGKLVCPTKTTPGAVVPTPTNIWFPLPPSTTSLPPKPSYTTAPELVPANSATVDACFDPDNVDVQQLFNNFIPPGDTNPTYDVSLNVPTLVQPRNETVPISFRLRSVLVGLYASYSLQPIITDVSVKTNLVSVSTRIVATLLAGSANYTYSGDTAAFDRNFVVVGAAGACVFAGIAAELVASNQKALSASYLVSPEIKTLLFLPFDSSFADRSLYNINVGRFRTGLKPEISPIAKFGGGSLDPKPDGDFFNSGLQYYLDTLVAPSSTDDFAIELWFYIEESFIPFYFGTLWSIDNVASPTSTKNYQLIIRTIPDGPDTDSYLTLCDSDDYQYPEILIQHPQLLAPQTWYHVVLTRVDGILYLALDGVWSEQTAEALIDLRNRNMIGNFAETANDSPNDGFDGLIDSFRVLSKCPYSLEGFSVPLLEPRLDDFDNAALGKRLTLQLDAGSCSVSGQGSDFTVVLYTLQSDGGSVNCVGQSAEFTRSSYVLIADKGSFSYTGIPTVAPPVFHAAGVGSGVSGVGTVSAPLPASLQVNDILLYVGETSGADDDAFLFAAGWSVLPGLPLSSGSGTKLNVLWRRVTSLPVTAPTAQSVGDHLIHRIYAFRGAKRTGNPFAEHASAIQSTPSATFTAPGVTTNSRNCKILVIASQSQDTSLVVFTGVSNSVLTNKYGSTPEQYNSTFGNGGGAMVWWGDQILPGFTGDTSAGPMGSGFTPTFSLYTVALLPDG